MSFPNNSIEYCPVRTNIDWSQVQFSDYPNQEVQVADYSKVEYFQPSDSDEEQSDEAGQHANGQNGHSAEGGNVSGGDGLASPTSPTDGTTPISSKTAKNKAKKAKQKAKEKAKKAAALSGESTPLETPMTPLSPVSPDGQLGEGDQAATPKSKNKKKKKKSKSKNSLDSAPASPPPELASTEPSSVQQPESGVQETEAALEPASEPLQEPASEPLQEPASEPLQEQIPASESIPAPEPAKDVMEDASAAPAEAAKAVEPEQPDQSSSIVAESTNESTLDTTAPSTSEPAPEQVQTNGDVSSPLGASSSIAGAEEQQESAPEPAADLVEPLEAKEDTVQPIETKEEPAEPEMKQDIVETLEAKEEAPQTKEDDTAAAIVDDGPSLASGEEQTSSDGLQQPAQDSPSLDVKEEAASAPEAASEAPKEIETSESKEDASPLSDEPSQPAESSQIESTQEEVVPSTSETIEPAKEQISSESLQQPAQDSPSLEEEATPAPEAASEAPKEIETSESKEDASPLSDEHSQPTESSQIESTQEEVVPSTSETIESAKEPETVQSQEPSGNVAEPQQADASVASEAPAAIEEVKEAEIPASDVTKNLQEASVPEQDVAVESTEQAAALISSEPQEQPSVSEEQPSESPVDVQEQLVSTESDQPAPVSSGEAEFAPIEQTPSEAPLSTEQAQPADSVTEDSKPEVADTVTPAIEEQSESIAQNDDSVSTEQAAVPELAGLETKEFSQDEVAQSLPPSSDQKDDSSPAQVERAASPAPVELSAIEAPKEDSSAEKIETVQEESAESPAPISGDAQQSVAEESAPVESVSQDDEVTKSLSAGGDLNVDSQTVQSTLPESTSTDVEPTTAVQTSEEPSLPSTSLSAPVEAVIESSAAVEESTAPSSAPAEVPSPAEDLDSKTEEGTGVEALVDEKSVHEERLIDGQDLSAVEATPAVEDAPAVQDTPAVEDVPLESSSSQAANDSSLDAPSVGDKEADAPQKENEEAAAPLPADTIASEPQPEVQKDAELPAKSDEPVTEETVESSPVGATDAQEISSEAPVPQSEVLEEKTEQSPPENTSLDSAVVDEAQTEAKEDVKDEAKIEPTPETDKLDVTESEPLQGNEEGSKLEEAIPAPENDVAEAAAEISEPQPGQKSEGASEPEPQQVEAEVEKPTETLAPVTDSQPEQHEAPQAGEDQLQQQIPSDELKEPVVALEDGMADKGEVPPIDDIHDVKSHVASNLVDENLPTEEEDQSRDVPAEDTNIQPQIGEDISTDVDTEAVPITTVDDTSNDNDLMTSNETINTIPIETSNEIPIVESSGAREDQLAQSGDAGQGLEGDIPSSNDNDGPSSEVVVDSSVAQEIAEKEAPQEQQDAHLTESSAGSGDSSDIPAVAAGALAAGSLLVTPAVVQAADAISQNDDQSSQDNVVRDISQGIPSEPSAHDLPPRSPSPTPDAATAVESSKSPSAGSQYGTITSDQQAAQAVQSNELRERSAASGAESSAKSPKQDVVVKDEVLAKPSAASTTPDILEPPDEPEPVSADDNDPVVVQEGVIPGSGVGDEDRGDRDSEAVVGDADEKEIATQSGLEDTSQPLIEDSNDDCGLPSSPIVLQPVDEDQAVPSSEQQLEQSTETTQITQDDHPESNQILEQPLESSLPPQLESGTLEESSTNQPEEGRTVEVPGQPISEDLASDGAQEPRPLTPDIAEKSQIGSSIESPPSLAESRLPEQTLDEPQQVDELVADSSDMEKPSAEQMGNAQPSIQQRNVEEPPTIEQATLKQPIIGQPSDIQPNDEQPSIEEPIIEETIVEHPSVEAPSHDSPILAPSTVDQPGIALEANSQSSENASDRQQETESENILPESAQETSINLEPGTTNREGPESGISTDEGALSQSRGPEDLQKDHGVPDSEQSNNLEKLQVIDSVVSEQASDSEDVQPGISLEQDSQEIVSQTQPPESSLITDPAQSSRESTHNASDLPVDQAENMPATLPSSSPSNLDPSNDTEVTMTPPVDTPSDAVDAQNDSQQLENAEALGSGTPDISGELDRDLLGAELSQNEQDAPGPSLESSDVLPLDEQLLTVTDPLDSGDAQVLDESEPTGQEVDGTNDALVVSPKRSAEELPPSTMEQAPSGDLSEPPLDTVVNEEIVPSSSGPSTPIVESQAPLTDPEEGQGQDEPAQSSEEVMDNAGEAQSHTGESCDDSQPKNDLERSLTPGEELVSLSQEQDRDFSSPPGASSQETVDQSAGDVEAVVESDLHITSSGHNSGQSTPKPVPLSSEIEASSHAPEGQEAPSSPTDQKGDHLELSQESDSVVDQDGRQEDGIAAPEQPAGELAADSHGHGLSLKQIVLDGSGIDDSGPKEEAPTQEVTAQGPVSQDIDVPSGIPSESGPDPVIDGKRSIESLSQQPDEQTSVDENDIKNPGIVAGTAAAAGIVVHELVSSKDDVEDRPVAVSGSTDDIQRPRTADKGTGTLEESAPDQNDLEMRSISSAAPDSPEEVSLQQPLSESFTIVDPPLSSDQDQAIQDSSEKPVLLSRVDSSTQTDELWRPKTPLPRGGTPGIELPDPNDAEAMGRSRARSSRRMSRQSVHQAEEVVAAAVIIRAAADTLGETSNRMAVHVKDLKQHGETTAPSNLQVDGRGKESPKTDEKLPRSPRSREHRASHSSRSSRPSTREDGTTRSSHHRHSSHRHRADGERESDQVPRTPPRHQDTAEGAHGSHSSRSRRERTPQEQAEHDRRKEERRLAREKEKANADSPVTESKGKEVEAPPSADRSHRSSRRHSSTRHSVASPSNTARTEASTAAPSKKFFDMKNGQSVMGSTFGGPLTADSASTATKDKDTISSSRRSKEVSRPPPVELKRSSTTRSSKGVRRSLEQSHAKLQKARQEESTKAAKESQPRRDDSSSPSPADGKKSKEDDKHRKSRLEKREKEDKDEKKKSSGGLKGMFKRLFSN